MAERTPPENEGDDLDAPIDEERDEDTGSDLADDDAADEAEPEPDEGGEDDEPSEQQTRDREPQRDERRETRGSRQFGKLREENRRLREQLYQRPPAQQPDQRAADEERRRREAEEDEQVYLTGDPRAISQHVANRTEQRINARVGRLEFFSADAADKAEFDRECGRNPMVDSVAQEVEERLSIARQQGHGNPSRIALAKLILGERVLSRAGKARGRQEAKASRERDRQRARPSSSRGDAGGGSPARRRGNEDTHAARARRLDESGEL